VPGEPVAPRIVVVGSANVDFTVAAPRLPRPGETVTDGTLLVTHGGKGANQALAARRLGAETRLLACVGDDDPGRRIRAALEAEGVGVAGVSATSAAATGTALIVVDGEGHNQIAVAPGANRALGVEQARSRAEDLAWADVVVCSLEVPLLTAAWAIEEGRRHRAITVLNPAPLPDAPLDFLARVDYLTPNAGEAERMSGIDVRGAESAAKAAERLLALGPRVVVVTLGEGGAVACGPDGRVLVPSFRVAAVDTTGAGDAFTGALAVALAEGRALTPALAFANAAAALACTRRGAQAALPARAEVERLLGTWDTMGPP
jgi:ribokinase